VIRAVLFGGQGTEVPRMGLEIAAEHAPARALLERAGALAGVDASALLESGGTALSRTAVIQPLLVAVQLGALALLGTTYTYAAGHSLGELSAWSAAGALTAEAAVELAAARGAAMERETTRHPGGMVALTNTSAERIAGLLARAPGCVLAAHNAPGEYTLSGPVPALKALAAHVRTTRLPVAGAWHSPAMADAVEDVLTAARERLQASHTATVITNRTGEAAASDADVAELLAGQLVRPVQWARTLATLGAAGVEEYLVVGPGKLMRALVAKNLGHARVRIVETLADLRETAA
jgi:[acyl-carrier-protein] S-malonyltransferase